MCGLVGFWQPGKMSEPDAVTVATAMSAQIQHRGPDNFGVWCDAESGVTMAHRRLSILDLSPAGHQPMLSECGRYVLILNGEIYNHLVLREELDKDGSSPLWRGHSDTETLLAVCSARGIERTLKATVGMFALALWDRKDKILTLARDRAGEKPLYYGWSRGVFLFGSELKALKAHPAFDAKIDRGALALMLRHNCIPAPHSIYVGIQKLMPGHYLQITAKDRSEGCSPRSRPYWRFNDAVESGLTNRFHGSVTEAIDLLESQLMSSVGSQMVADVPLGAFLSGGIDSSTIVALMQAQSDRPVRTFTIGSNSADYNEASHAKEVARHLGTSHTELYVSPADALAVIPKLPTIYCEPFSDSSQIPTYLVSAMASDHVKVALSGDGGDELFGGYNRYLLAQSVWTRMQRFPKPARRVVAALLKSASAAGWDRVFAVAGKLLPESLQLRTPGEKAHKLAGVLLADDGASFYRNLVSHWQDPASIVLDAEEPPTLLSRRGDWPETDNFVEWMMAMDAQTYMSDDILTKVDRAAMANSLETRVPFLDHRVIESAWRFPLSMKIRNGEGKWLLRQILYRHVPKELINRPKMGFGNPLHDWLRGPLRDWAEDLLDANRIRRGGYFDPAPIRELWDFHLSGRSNEQYPLWDVLMFQAWLAEQ
ncbi:Asparagine synthetase [uncultured Woeseiaceae bacterium]|uniref:asparagine synthase (glutamine-hydrolyzing) n=1 Tax=uncultured Woeseiaceae bacterium TaxID=1983305 RepID=A0A7D9H325_9GAMM|nr:Asparagine synthetase [uncultured Woeseiaceae bacterium]